MQVHNYTEECPSFFKPSVFKWLRTFEGKAESRHQGNGSQAPWKCCPSTGDRAGWVVPLGCQGAWWNQSRDLLPPTLPALGIVSGHQGALSPQSLLSSCQSQPWGPTEAVSELPAAQRGCNTQPTVWTSVWTELSMAYQPRYTHSQVSFL